MSPEEQFDRGASGISIHDPAKASEVQPKNIIIRNYAGTMPLLDSVDWHRLDNAFEHKGLDKSCLNFPSPMLRQAEPQR
jgi:hypothetical protein